jgi:hypothetical protein
MREEEDYFKKPENWDRLIFLGVCVAIFLVLLY